MMLFVIGAAQRAGAQTAPGQASADKPPATTFNPATDKLDRTQAGPIIRPMIVEIPGLFPEGIRQPGEPHVAP